MSKKDDLKPEHRVFAENYVIEWNATQSYLIAYPNSSYDSARSSASDLLTNPNIAEYIEEIQKDLGRLCGVSAARNILELKKIAYTNISDFKDGWLTQKEFEELTSDQKAALSEIQYTTKTFQGGEENIVKFKVHDKQRAIEIMNKMLGYNAADKSEIEITENMTEDDRLARLAVLKGKLDK